MRGRAWAMTLSTDCLCQSATGLPLSDRAWASPARVKRALAASNEICMRSATCWVV